MSKTSTTTMDRVDRRRSTVRIQHRTDQLVVEDFVSWSGQNRLGEYSSAGGLVVESTQDDTVRLEYDDTGWFLSNIRKDCSSYTHLELDVQGDDGGEGSDIYLEVDTAEAPLAELSGDTVETDWSTVRVDLRPLNVDRTSIQDVWLTFWGAGTGAIELNELRFVADDTIEVGEYEARDSTGDGLHNDFDGDGDTTFEDVSAFADNLDDEGVQNNPDAFDFDDNGRIGFSDILELLRSV